MESNFEFKTALEVFRTMRKNLVISLLLGISFWLKATTLESTAKKPVPVDNEYIHTYQNKAGKWLLPSDIKTSVVNQLKEFESDELEFRAINNFRDGEALYANRPLFFPYGEEYLNSLIASGKGRDVIVADVRDFIWPVSTSKSSISSKLGSRHGSFHAGIDIQCPTKSPIVASFDGVVVESGFNGNYGLAVQIKHEFNQLSTLYAHNSVLLVKTGEHVKKGQIIAFSGSTGHSTGPHLHFEVRYQNIVLNPEHFLLPPTHAPGEKLLVQKEENLR